MQEQRQPTSYTPTLIRSQIIGPDKTPRRGVRVEFIVRSSSTWRADRKGRIVGTTSVWTAPNGCWQVKLLPAEAYLHHKYVYVEVVEGGVHAGFMHVKPALPDGGAYWMGELLIDEPPVPPSLPVISGLTDLHDVADDEPAEGDALVFRDAMWRPSQVASRLSGLLDVDAGSVEAAGPGAALVLHQDGMWRAVPLQLGQLINVDRDSVQNPSSGATFTYISNRIGWGDYSYYDRNTPGLEITNLDDGYTVRIRIYGVFPSDSVAYRWDYGDDPGGWISWDFGAQPEHTYTEDGTYTIGAQFADNTDPGSINWQDIDIPYPVNRGEVGV